MKTTRLLARSADRNSSAVASFVSAPRPSRSTLGSMPGVWQTNVVGTSLSFQRADLNRDDAHLASLRRAGRVIYGFVGHGCFCDASLHTRAPTWSNPRECRRRICNHGGVEPPNDNTSVATEIGCWSPFRRRVE
jgi:hypothetical protein